MAPIQVVFSSFILMGLPNGLLGIPNRRLTLLRRERERQRSTVCVIITKIDLVLLLSYYTMDVDWFDENQTENNKDYCYVEDGGKPTLR